MQKETLYRAWLGCDNRMVYDMFYIKQDTAHCYYWELNGGWYDCGEDAPTLLQYVGKNAVVNNQKVFDSDICKATFKTKGGIMELTGEILMDEFMWCIRDESINDPDYGNIFSLNRVEIIEVIGNIYETPELLK